MRLSRPPVDEDEEQDSAFWLVTYSDMTTLLLAFFLVIYSFTILGKDRQDELVKALNVVVQGGKVRDSELPPVDLEKTAEKIAALMSEHAENEKAWVQASESEVVIGLPSGITFASGDASLTPIAREHLVQVVELLREVPNVIRVEGHTDNVPMAGYRFPTNWHLSVARAQSVVRLFIEAGLDPQRLLVLGHADNRPRESNETPEGRNANRRIEIRLLKSQSI